MNGKQLIDWGFEPGPWFAQAILLATNMELRGETPEKIREYVSTLKPKPKIKLRETSLPYGVFINPQTDEEEANVKQVHEAMGKLMQVPTVVHASIMPDACPAGIIPVGGVVATANAIHPGFHSADVCCSMAITILNREVAGKALLDVAMQTTHFGPLPKNRSIEVKGRIGDLIGEFYTNHFLEGLEVPAVQSYMTQGDGNHFFYVGRVKSSGLSCIVTHHGSRVLGAQLYKRGIAQATKETAKLADGIPKEASWFSADSYYGEQYWDALQRVRRWTKYNHFDIHHEVISRLRGFSTAYADVDIEDQFWNEHNFVFQKENGLFYHAKGATPSFSNFSSETDGRCLIPMNMAEPILITRPTNNKKSLEFAPHGAGRNESRTQFLKRDLTEMPKDIDVRFYCGVSDPSELPSAYKDSGSVIQQIKQFNLATIVDEVLPYGTIMAGNYGPSNPDPIESPFE